MSGPHLSRDGGRTWQPKRNRMPPISDWHYSAPVERVLFDPNAPNRLIAIGGSQRRFYSPGEPMWGQYGKATMEVKLGTCCLSSAKVIGEKGRVVGT